MEERLISGRRSQRSRRGVTLVEVLIVVAVMALLSGVLLGTGSVGGARLRTAATLVLTGIRLGMTHANTTGLPTRLVFDFEASRIGLEETTGRMLRVKDEDGDADEADPSAGAKAATAAEREAQEEAERIVEGPREPPPTFSPLASFHEESGKLGRALGDGVKLVSVQTEHDAVARTAGRAYLYFWPGGATEQAVVQLTRAGRDEPLSVIISALSGHSKIVRGAIELDDPREDVDFGERDEE